MSASTHLSELARLVGVQPAYEDVLGRRCEADEEALLRVLRSLDVPVERAEDAGEAIRRVRQARWRRVVEPVTVVTEGRAPTLSVRLPEGRRRGAFRVALSLEDGEARYVDGRLEDLPVTEQATAEGCAFAEVRVDLPRDLPLGYHRVAVATDGDPHSGWLIHAPAQAWLPDEPSAWGVFVPTHALHDSTSWGAGNLGDLARFADFVSSLGGGVVGTLPLTASFLDEPFDPSPYAPVSRLAWNELFLDLQGVPEWGECAEARRLAGSPEWSHALAELRGSSEVDYRRQWAHMRPVLDRLARYAFGESATRAALEEFAAAHPYADGYARFRAVMASEQTSWAHWPERLREGRLGQRDGDPDVYRRHLYAQWRLEQQLDEVCARAGASGPGLYLDMPLGVHPDGYDAWRERESFAADMAAGAPPDDFFTRGQNWGFAPPHPHRIREQGYRYFAACLQSQLRRAGMLRIDHVMWMHRLFFVPHGMEATRGVYVRYRPEELYGVLALESRRGRGAIVGEDLGTVPDGVRETMSRRGVLRMYVLQFEAGPDRLGEVPRDCIASLNTHDMPPFAGWWRASDVDDRVALGFLDSEQAEGARADRARTRDQLRRSLAAGRPGAEPTVDDRSVSRASLAHLADSPARVVIVNLEDLWLEDRPQNVPGTGPERPNWRGRARIPVEGMRRAEDVITPLREVHERRNP